MALDLPLRLSDATGAPFVVRAYEATDYPALERMYEHFEPKRAAQGLPPSGEAGVRRWLERVLGDGEHLLVDVGSAVLGHIMLIPMDGTVELANFLHQSIRGRGIGTRLNRIAVQLARERGYHRIWLSVEPGNRAAVRSYEKAGFRRLPGSLWAPEIEMQVELEAESSEQSATPG